MLKETTKKETSQRQVLGQKTKAESFLEIKFWRSSMILKYNKYTFRQVKSKKRNGSQSKDLGPVFKSQKGIKN
jgi:hypothetical protein